MKSRSNRLPTSDPPDDWVNGSWVVDCICGVNFDDGEEMVNCDECGVWVHTRCSRYVKGEKSFACDKCKNKSSRNNSEETEVAQLLVELPTKTIKMNSNPYPLNNLPWPPYRPWNDRPIEERVHVQGVPGGDPSLFQGFSSIFNSELWKCTGYVPKKFNFRYREFPCWDQEEGDVDAKADGDTENVVNKGAGVLYSLSKETFGGSRAPGLVSMKGQVKAGGSDKKVSKEWKLEGSDLKNSHLQNSTKKEKLRSPLPQCVKRSREDPGPSKDHCLKKKNRTVQKEHDKKDKVHTFKTVVIHSPNARQAEVIDAKAHKAAEFDAIDNRLEHGKDTECKVLTSTAQKSMDGCVEKPKRNAAIDQEDLTPRSGESAGFGYSSHKRVKTERLANDASDTAKSEEISSPSLAKDASVRDVGKKETQLHDSDRNQGAQLETAASDLPEAKPRNEIVTKSAVEVQDTEDPQNLDVTAQLSPTYCNSKTKLSVNVDDVKDVSRSYPSDHVAKSDFVKGLVEQVQSTDHDVNFKVNGAGPTTSQSPEHEGKGAGGDLKSAGICKVEKDDKIGGDSYDNRAKSDGLESSTGIAKFSSESKEVAKGSGDSKNLAGTTPASPPRQRKIVSAGKSSLGSSTIVLAKYSLADRNRTGISQSSSLVGKEMMSNSSVESKKESEPVDSLKGQGKHDKSKSTVKANLKSSVGSVTKSSQASKPGNSAVFKHYTSVGKDSLRHVSSKSSSVEGASRLVDIAEPASLPTQHTVHGQSKNTASAGQQRGEKASQSHSQLPSKSTQSASGHLATSSSPAGLSDEELALLLHQELNSSPRVPRVPRVRQTGSLPQLSSASATSMLIKRTSSSGGKEHHTFSRRKGKDVHKDGPRSSHERDIETRKGDRVSSPSDSAKTSDALPSVAAKQETLHSAKKNAEQISTNSGRSSVDANEVKISSSRDSPVNTSDHDTTISKGHGSSTHRTLPGLIAEIMGKGRRMTYEELCNAVLPHWPNLRKHNGERYAYSSHSQAVLDCLRNRTEWAQLVDRGPKTNASRKKRKLDSEAMSTESEDGEGKSVESRKEEFPKGRRKARKGRRLTLRGRSVKSDRRRKLEAGSDHTGSFSDSGEETESSEDGSHGSGLCAARSSDEVGAVS